MSMLGASIEGIGFWTRGLPSWEHACAFARDGQRPDTAPARPSPQLLAPNERRRAPETVAAALEVALAACTAAGRAPRSLPSVFTSMHGEQSITDYMCATLAEQPATISPTRFHNSVHNAAAGYWTIGTGAMHPATALSAGPWSFAQGLLEALTQLACGTPAVLLVACDGPGAGPLAGISRSHGLLAGALVLSSTPQPDRPRLQVEWSRGAAATATGALARHTADNSMTPMLPLFDALAVGLPDATLDAGAGRMLRIRIDAASALQPGRTAMRAPA